MLKPEIAFVFGTSNLEDLGVDALEAALSCSAVRYGSILAASLEGIAEALDPVNHNGKYPIFRTLFL